MLLRRRLLLSEGISCGAELYDWISVVVGCFESIWVVFDTAFCVSMLFIGVLAVRGMMGGVKAE